MTEPNPIEAAGAWALLRDVLSRSDPARDGGPEFYVPEDVRTALQTALIDVDDRDAETEALREREQHMRGLLVRARAVLRGSTYARLRADIEGALKA